MRGYSDVELQLRVCRERMKEVSEEEKAKEERKRTSSSDPPSPSSLLRQRPQSSTTPLLQLLSKALLPRPIVLVDPNDTALSFLLELLLLLGGFEGGEAEVGEGSTGYVVETAFGGEEGERRVGECTEGEQREEEEVVNDKTIEER
jgi:hypothetical protein